MAMVVNHNIPALMTYNTVNRTNSALEKSIQKLSTGLRINSAADDAAGLAISEKMRAQINGLDRAVSNAQDGISMIQTAEGALNETHSILQRMRELSVQAANDTLTQQDRAYIQLEIDQLREEITRIGNTTQFNKKKLLNGDAAVLWSSSDLSTKAIINGGLRTIDQFGQKSSAEGNYKITVKAEPGQAEVQKSDIFKIKHPNVLMNVSTNPAKGAEDVRVNNVPAGDITIKGAAELSGSAAITVGGIYDVAQNISYQEITIDKSKITGSALTQTAAITLKLGDVELGTIEFGGSAGTGIYISKINGQDTGNDPAVGQTKKDLANAVRQVLESATLPDGVSRVKYTDSSGNEVYRFVNTSGSKVGLSTSSGATDITLTHGATGSAVNSITLKDIVTPALGSNATALDFNANILFEVTDVNTAGRTVTLKATANILNGDGTTRTSEQKDIVLVGGGGTGATAVDLDELLGEKIMNLTLSNDNLEALSKGSKFVYNLTPQKSGLGSGSASLFVSISGEQNPEWSGNWSSANGNTGITNEPVTYGLKSDVAGQEIHFRNYYLDEKTGDATLGEIILTTNEKFKGGAAPEGVNDGDMVASFHSTYIGEVAGGDVRLRDLDKFWTSEGVFTLNDPQTITITQGDGKQASVTLYATDTLDDVRAKLNTAIATGLGQGQYVDDAKHFATFVTKDNKVGMGDDSVEGTFVLRSVIPGAAGTLSFSGDENIINAFSLNVLHDPSETTYSVTVKDAHTDEVLAADVQVTGNVLKGVIHPNVDVQFDPLTGVEAKWNSTRNTYDYSGTAKETILHLSDNTTVFQIGANEGEDMGIHIGDMRATALGLDSVLVTDRASASRSITIIDNAIDRVSTQRAKLGAYQNRLEHTINNLNTASENLTAAESRIRDTDMAKEMMNFTKLQIMLQAGTSMLAQANQLPQNVRSLVR